MIVVSDTSPLCYLVLLNLVEILPTMYGTVVIPEAVWQELVHERSPEVVRQWIAQSPPWLQVEGSMGPVDSMLSELGLGEQQAVLLSEKLHAC
ncbi:MAG: hypothetical protein AAGD25_36805 [Cyanobacteria bacterium P01_F01_bin.150]